MRKRAEARGRGGIALVGLLLPVRLDIVKAMEGRGVGVRNAFFTLYCNCLPSLLLLLFLVAFACFCFCFFFFLFSPLFFSCFFMCVYVYVCVVFFSSY